MHFEFLSNDEQQFRAPVALQALARFPLWLHGQSPSLEAARLVDKKQWLLRLWVYC
jgi:hypothetical protein